MAKVLLLAVLLAANAIGDPPHAPQAPLAIAGTCPNGFYGVPYTCTLTAVGGTPPYAWTITVGSLPPGLTAQPSTDTTQLIISGIPTGAAPTNLQVISEAN
jgi:hypothetical protein